MIGITPGFANGLPRSTAQKPFFQIPPRKNRPSHSRSYGVSQVKWTKLCKKTNLDKKGLDVLWERCISAVFWQTGRDSGILFTRTQSDGFTGFYGYLITGCMAIRARFGLFFSMVHTLWFQRSPTIGVWSFHISNHGKLTLELRHQKISALSHHHLHCPFSLPSRNDARTTSPGIPVIQSALNNPHIYVEGLRKVDAKFGEGRYTWKFGRRV